MGSFLSPLYFHLYLLFLFQWFVRIKLYFDNHCEQVHYKKICCFNAIFVSFSWYEMLKDFYRDVLTKSNCFLAAPWPTLCRYWGGSLTHPMLVTAFSHIWSEVHKEPRNKVGSQRLGECLVWFEPGTFWFWLQRLNTLGHSPRVCCISICLIINNQTKKQRQNNKPFQLIYTQSLQQYYKPPRCSSVQLNVRHYHGHQSGLQFLSRFWGWVDKLPSQIYWWVSRARRNTLKENTNQNITRKQVHFLLRESRYFLSF